MKSTISLLAITALAVGSFALGHVHGFRTRENHAWDAGYRYGYFRRALFDQRMQAAEHGQPAAVPGFEAEASAWESTQATPPSTSFLPAGH